MRKGGSARGRLFHIAPFPTVCIISAIQLGRNDLRAALPLTAALLLGACNMHADAREDNGDHQNIRRNFQVGDFQKISLPGSPNVVVTVGGTPSVRAEGDKAEIDRLD